MFSGRVSNATSWTQSSTALFAGLLSPIPGGGEMAGAMLSMIGQTPRRENMQFERFSPVAKKKMARPLERVAATCARGGCAV